jgi:hypothetical protein
MESTLICKSIWIPCFKKLDGFKSFNLKNSNSLKDISQISINKNSIEKDIEFLEQNIEIEMKGDNDYKNGLKLLPNENDIVIKNSFLIAVINMDILSEFSIPTIFTTIVKKDSFIEPYGP